MVYLNFWENFFYKRQCKFELCHFYLFSFNFVTQFLQRQIAPSNKTKSNLYKGFILNQCILGFGTTHSHKKTRFFEFLLPSHIISLIGWPNWHWKISAVLNSPWIVCDSNGCCTAFLLNLIVFCFFFAAFLLSSDIIRITTSLNLFLWCIN